MPVVVLALALGIAAVAGRAITRRQGANMPELHVGGALVDMLLVGLVVGRLGFVLQWWALYREDPWTILRVGDGGISPWAGGVAALALAAWRVRRTPALRRPLAWAVGAGALAWALLDGGIWLVHKSRIQLPDTGLERLDGGTVQLSQLRGQPVVINLWATWCPPCRREMPVLAQGQREHPGISFVFANQGENAADVRAFLRTGPLVVRNVVLDPVSAVSQAVGARGLPTTLFFDADGRLADTHMGELTRAGLAQKLRGIARPGPGASLPSPPHAPPRPDPLSPARTP